MLNEMPVSKVTMNGLSRLVGLAKSNVMRYFESREAVLLDLLTGRSGRTGRRPAERVRYPRHRHLPGRDEDRADRSPGPHSRDYTPVTTIA
jgi:AcrR family transcriptional regulator